MDAAELIETWRRRGSIRNIGGHDIFVVDEPAGREAGHLPVLVLHGYPTSSIDFLSVLPSLAAERRVVLFDMLGYGLSSKPDQSYSLFEQADIAEAVALACGLGSVALLTHDMGDSVGGELLARGLDGALGFAVERRVISNGSIYLDLAQLTDGQQFLLSLPDERLDNELPTDAFLVALQAILTPTFPPDDPHLVAATELVVRDGGGSLQPRLVRYIEERRVHEGRWTGAIETHPSPVGIVWGVEDPVAVWPMAERLGSARPDAGLERLDGVGHYPMIEAPGRFAEAALRHLG